MDDCTKITKRIIGDKSITREEIKEPLPILKAFAKGKAIQDKIEGITDWVDTDEINLEYEGQKILHRIKPEPKYRPFKNQEECWEEMHKHPDFGWIRDKEKLSYYPIQEVSNTNHYLNLLNDYEFTDGTPFGIKEE